MLLPSLAVLCSTLGLAQASVTVYSQIPLGTSAGPNGPATTPAAYNKTRLVPPPIPSPPPPNAFTLTLSKDAGAVNGLSIPHVGPSFWGFSIEMSVIGQVLGKNSSFITVPFLNLMANLQERSGGVVIRLGGNTQEFATMVPSLANGSTFSKADSGSTQTTKTPAVLYTIDMFYMANNISSLVNVKWFLGIPFNDSVNWRLTIAEEGQQILGSNLLGLQAGNEPDFYGVFGRRASTYAPADYSNDLASMITAMDADSRIPNKNMLIGPSVATGPWTPEQVWDTGFIDRFKDRLYSFAVEHYPNNNCAAQFNTTTPIIDPQTIFGTYTTHTALVNLVQPYLNSAMLAQQAQKPIIMFETNTASCGGFAGISDSYGAALWAIDYGMQLAYGNFTHGLLHVGGQNAFYNPFTAPPVRESVLHQWTVGAIYYSAIVLAEAFGKTNTSQIVDLGANGGNNISALTPAYAIYEQNTLSKMALINYMDDGQTGANALSVTVSVPTGVPGSVQVKYLTATSVSDKDNIAWAGQTLGNQLTVDGRFRGSLNITTINCDTTANQCIIPVPAPGFALVFFSSSSPALSVGQATQTFSTSAYTKAHNTAQVDPSVLATSNGHSGATRQLGSTSNKLRNDSLLLDGAAGVNAVAPGLSVLLAAVVGGVFVVLLR
ncbi:glycoside hydrolase family 79 protein [Phlegmacium glaucopus]|nr:glycoside hydrolase family 79 protein [Phlegmacium glaucopus]